MNEKINIDVGKLFLEEFKDTLERVIILLEDNPKIEDTEKFYKGEEVLTDVVYFHREIGGLLK